MAILLTRAAFAHSKQAAATSNTLPKNTQNDDIEGKQMKRTGRDKLLGKRQGISSLSKEESSNLFFARGRPQQNPKKLH